MDGGLEGWRDGGLEGWRPGGLQAWRDGGLEGWRDGGLEAWRDACLEGCRPGGMEAWRDGGLEGCRPGGLEGWRDGGLEGWRPGGMELQLPQQPFSVECYCQHESGAAVIQLQFLINEGALVSALADDSVHLWNLRQKRPAILHSLKFSKERRLTASDIQYAPASDAATSRTRRQKGATSLHLKMQSGVRRLEWEENVKLQK
ncbi:Syntaxin-binding protein 5 [Liparis tanakae]|uniref:Syntaxin-binding protein 5 n=1 Tax=Liparis tanakae TaxID=230148 RepID=A0A4Z2HJA5_9TELE|nr:Syntaxin-binding protein 5 [Liparis tanakae]